MKRSLHILLALTFTVLLAACKKKPLPPEDGEDEQPVFYAQCQVNGFNVRMQAGTNDYYMKSSYLHDDSTDVYVYKAELMQKNCTSACGYALTILINDAMPSAKNSIMDPSVGLKLGQYGFNSNQLPTLKYKGIFTPDLPQVNGASYGWEFSDGAKLYGYSVTRDELPANKSLSAKLIYNSSCNVSHLNTFTTGRDFKATVSSVKNNTVASDYLAYNFSANVVGGVPPYDYLWQFDDGNGPTPVAQHMYNVPGVYTVKLIVTDHNKDTCSTYYQLAATREPATMCTANYHYAFEPVKNIGLSAITILITDPSGKVYSSKESLQPDDSSFEIVSVDDYKSNENGDPTKKIKIRFKCTLKNGGTPLVIDNGEAVIAVSFNN